ncbi:MAG: hypothetical protein ACPGQS_01315 [Bradymonadia bacterium]
MNNSRAKRDWYVTFFEYCLMWPIGLWGVTGIVYYFLTEAYRTDELIAAILLGVVGWYRFRPLPKKTTDAEHSDVENDEPS